MNFLFVTRFFVEDSLEEFPLGWFLLFVEPFDEDEDLF
jgi:hypothetical protein